MIKGGLQVPVDNTNGIDSLIGHMQRDGVKTAGSTFINNPTIQYKKLATPGDIAPSLSDISSATQAPKEPLANRILKAEVGAAKAVYNWVKPAAKNAYGLVSQPFQAVPKVGFALTHGGQMEDSWTREQYNKKVADVNSQYNSLNDALRDGRMDKPAYDKALEDLNSWSGTQLDELHQKMVDANLRVNGFRDWQTGQYKETATPSDIFNIVDGAVSIYAVGTAGMGKGAIMQSAKEGLFKSGGNFFTESIAYKFPKTAGVIDGVLSKTITKIPGLNEYADRQIAKLGGDITAKAFVKSALAETIMNAPLRQMNMESAREVVDSIMKGEFLKTPEGKSWINSGVAQSFMLAGMALEGGPLGFLTKYLGKAGSATKVALFGDQAVKELDGITGSKLDHFFRILSGDANDATLGYKWLTEHPDEMARFKSVYATWLDSGKLDNIWQDAAAGIIKDLSAGGKELNIENAMAHMFNWQRAGEIGNEITKTLQAAGKLEAGQQVAVVTFSREAQTAVRKDVANVIKDIANQAKLSGDVPKEVVLQAQKDAAIRYLSDHQAMGTAWAQHDGLVSDMVNAISDAKTAFGKKDESIVSAIKVKETAAAVKGVPRALTKKLAELGYYVGLPKNIGNPFVSIAEAAGTKLETTLISAPQNGMAKALGLTREAPVSDLQKMLGDDIAAVRGSSPIYGQVGALLRKSGLGLEEANKEAYKIITTNMAERIDKLGVGGVDTMNKLQQYAENSKTITDLRGMTQSEIQKAVGGISKATAKEIQKAIIQSHLDVPLEIRGLGDKIVDFAHKINPLQGVYQRMQGAARYSFNPFFQVQERAETKILSIMNTNGDNAFAATFGRFNPQTRQYLDEVATKMEKFNILEGTRYGEAANTNVVGRITASIGTMQKRDLASIVDSMAGKMGMSVDDLLTQHSAEVIDAIRPIVQYPKNGVINSNFARTLNFIAFPSRYNIKVAKLAVDTLARQTPAVQVAVTKGLMDFGNWLNSDEGLAWRQDYAKEIAFIKWLTPLGNLDWTFRTLQGKNTSYSEFGMLGGLPLGVFTQILNDQGVIDTQSPFIDPTSGAIYGKKIPTSVKGRLASALMDMLGSTFTYPGRTLALPGKTAFLRDVAYRVTGSSGRDFATKAPDMGKLTPEQAKAQKFWENRANPPAALPPMPVQTVPQADVKTAPPLPARGRHSKTEIRQARLASKASKGKKTKQPVNFNQVINR